MLNITPDSFSDGGNFLSVPLAMDRAATMLDEGADVIEVGGESTRPGARSVSASEEADRVLPVVRAIVKRWPHTPVAVDTVKSAVAEAALSAGASIVNDVSALRLDERISKVCAARGATLILMHSRGSVEDMASYERADYPDGAASAVVRELGAAAMLAVGAGVDPARIILDPGLGFSKRSAHSVEVLANVPLLLELGFEVMIGASRKRFIGELTGVSNATGRVAGTVGANVVALTLGASWFRVHDIRPNREALDVAFGILEARA